MMEYTTSDRGFIHLEPIEACGGQIKVYESSNALVPSIWLAVKTGNEVPPVSLSLEQAAQLAEQLRWLVEHHYQNGGER